MIDFELGKNKVRHKCPGCGHVWKVPAYRVEWSIKGGYQLDCYACAKTRSARGHEATAARLRAQAREIYARRKAKAGHGC